jgi:hypothetical protein
MIYIAMDDTDMPDTRGTGALARQLAAALADRCEIRGVSRHQLLRDPRVPMTKNNSANVVHVVRTALSVEELAEFAEAHVRANFIEGSDPGLCVAGHMAPRVVEFGVRAKRALVTQREALESLAGIDAVAKCLGGTGDGIIGAVAAVGLAASGNDGRFVQIGGIRELPDTVEVADLAAAGVERVTTMDGDTVNSGRILDGAKIRPEIVDNCPVVLVRPEAPGFWRHVRRD